MKRLLYAKCRQKEAGTATSTADDLHFKEKATRHYQRVVKTDLPKTDIST
jgi:hypothetical protein